MRRAPRRKTKRYVRRRPETTPLYAAVAHELETFLGTVRARDRDVPQFVERELRSYLECGILTNGFVRVRCRKCRVDRVVGFSCKGRGVCPSCTGRRMSETAADLVDRVLPVARTRQWVLSMPIALRWRMAYDSTLTSAVLAVYARVVQGWARKKARELSGLPRAKWRAGAVTFIQRFGSALNLNTHFHTLAPDVAWRVDEDGKVQRLGLPPPTDAEVEGVLQKVVRRVTRCLVRRGVLDEDGLMRPRDGDGESGGVGGDGGDGQGSLLDVAAAASVRGLIGTGERAGRRVETAGGDGVGRVKAKRAGLERRGRRCAALDGFSLHADVAIEATDRERLEKLCRYVARGPVANERLRRLDDGRYSYQLKTPWRDGTTAVIFTGHELMEKLCALIPRPQANLTRYHGVFAPGSKLRRHVVREAVQRAATELVRRGVAKQPSEAAKWVMERRRIEWAELMKRTWNTDVLECRRCHGRLMIVATITVPSVIDAMLSALKIVSDVPELARARPPPWEDDGQQVFDVA